MVLRMLLFRKRIFIMLSLLLGTMIFGAAIYFEINPLRGYQVIEPWESQYLDQLEIGDIVFRTAYGKESRVIQLVGEGQYSHIAVITALEPIIEVTHATTNEHPEKINQVLVTPIKDFLSPTLTKTYLIARPDFLTAAEKQLFVNHIAQQEGKPYLLNSRYQENLYCTTLLEKPLQKLKPELTLRWHPMQVPGISGDFLFPDAFLELEGMLPLLKDDIWVLNLK